MPAEFEQCLLSWVTALHQISGGQVIAIDGKTLRRSCNVSISMLRGYAMLAFWRRFPNCAM